MSNRVEGYRRERLWMWARRKHPQNQILPRRFMVLRWLLFPVETTYWMLDKSVRRYDPWSDTREINGVKVSGNLLRALTLPDGQWKLYKIVRDGDIVLVHERTIPEGWEE
jgi:hypothetical protein